MVPNLLEYLVATKLWQQEDCNRRRQHVGFPLKPLSPKSYHSLHSGARRSRPQKPQFFRPVAKPTFLRHLAGVITLLLAVLGVLLERV
jgi:hypothetical protein